MKRLAISALVLAVAAVPGAAMAGRDSGGFRPSGGMGVVKSMGHVKPVMTGMPRAHFPKAGGVRNWGGAHNGRWVGGHRAPGGWNAYRRPSRGFILPSYWISPSFYIPNYSFYGLSQPSYGYGWSRYYNDAVLTDRYGRVYDSVSDYNWDRYDAGYEQGGEDYADSYGYSDERVSYDGRYYDDAGYQDGFADDRSYRDDRAYRSKDRDGGLGGALVGGAVGGIAGRVIAGRGERTAGTLIGAGVGALAGAAIDINDRDGRGPSRKRLSNRAPAYPGYDDRGPRIDYDYADQGGYGAQPHWGGRGPAPMHHGGHPGRPGGQVVTHSGSTNVIHTGGGYRYGYGYGAPTVTTVIVQPAPVTKTVTTTTEYVTETVYVKPSVKRVWRPAPKRVVKAKPKPRCVCKIVYR